MKKLFEEATTQPSWKQFICNSMEYDTRTSLMKSIGKTKKVELRGYFNPRCLIGPRGSSDLNEGGM